MFDRFSIRARQVIFLSRWTAGMRGAEKIELEDLVHALIREDQGDFDGVMAQPGEVRLIDPRTVHDPFLSQDDARALLAAIAKPEAGDQDMTVEMIMAQPAQDVLAAATALADKKKHKTIEPLHLLAAIVEDQESPLAQLLLEKGITRQRVMRALE